jgi:hypothetical protein
MTVRAAFRQADVSRAVKGVQATGAKVDRVELDPVTGKIIVYTESTAANDDGASDWD